MQQKNIKIADYTYHLPDDKIAKFPLEERDSSKLLLYKQGQISDHHFTDLADLLPAESLLIVNNSKVIHARMIFQRETGARIEIFCQEPHGSSIKEQNEAIWNCMVGNAKKWKDERLFLKLNENEVLSAELLAKESENYIVKFNWTGPYTFWDILEKVGQLPIPPYLNREAEQSDEKSYQTVYAHHYGSVAAPTAGLHFTPQVLRKLSDKNIYTEEITLHVGAGTFKPVKSATMELHQMHGEYIQISLDNIEQLLKHPNRFCVGTTSLRTLETLYWVGVKLLKNMPLTQTLVEQWEPYEIESNYSYVDALEAVKIYILNEGALTGKTEILIAPGFPIRSVRGLITNFHQPNSTLLLLVAACIGDQWKAVYNHALNNNYRFLSYGDSSLLFVEKTL